MCTRIPHFRPTVTGLTHVSLVTVHYLIRKSTFTSLLSLSKQEIDFHISLVFVQTGNRLSHLSCPLSKQEIHFHLLAARRDIHSAADRDQHRRNRRRRRPRQALGWLQKTPNARSPRGQRQPDPGRSLAPATHRHRRNASHQHPNRSGFSRVGGRDTVIGFVRGLSPRRLSTQEPPPQCCMVERRTWFFASEKCNVCSLYWDCIDGNEKKFHFKVFSNIKINDKNDERIKGSRTMFVGQCGILTFRNPQERLSFTISNKDLESTVKTLFRDW